MPESVSTVDAILDGLRDRATGWSCVPLADAEAAVHAAAGLGSPDERLREALTDCAATLMTVAPILEAHVYEPNASGYVWNAWTRWGERAAYVIDAALAAADREAPDGER